MKIVKYCSLINGIRTGGSILLKQLIASDSNKTYLHKELFVENFLIKSDKRLKIPLPVNNLYFVTKGFLCHP